MFAALVSGFSSSAAICPPSATMGATMSSYECAWTREKPLQEFVRRLVRLAIASGALARIARTAATPVTEEPRTTVLSATSRPPCRSFVIGACNARSRLSRTARHQRLSLAQQRVQFGVRGIGRLLHLGAEPRQSLTRGLRLAEPLTGHREHREVGRRRPVARRRTALHRRNGFAKGAVRNWAMRAFSEPGIPGMSSTAVSAHRAARAWASPRRRAP